MPRTPLFDLFRQTTRKALAAESPEANALEARRVARMDRRSVLKGVTALGMGMAVRAARAEEARPPSALRVGIVGAGLAGLACAYELRCSGVQATVHEARERTGGRVFSMGGAFGGPVIFPGQVVERGGEFIDSGHSTMLGYAREFHLEREDLLRVTGDVFYFFGGQLYSEADILEEYCPLIAAINQDLSRLSEAPTAADHTELDRRFDLLDLVTYLEARNTGPLVKAAIIAAYEAEYGQAADELSCLNLLFLIQTEQCRRFEPYGESDERYRLLGGNQQIPRELAARLPGQVRQGERLESVRKTPTGALALTLRRGSTSYTATYDVVVLAVPFTVLRRVELAASLGLPAWKTRVIRELGYGTNAKMMVGYRGPVWRASGCSGASYSDLMNHQATWETNPTRATAGDAVLTDFASGPRGAGMDPGNVAGEAERFVAAMGRVVPGTAGAVKRGVDRRIVAHLEHWPSNPNALGSYSSYRPGQFTSLAGTEGTPVGNLYFAGEHTSSFYEAQGYMEGAAATGKSTAQAILAMANVAAASG
ncbi:FAD-dependent oxidoreductase [Myxococcus sp. CA033]|uniref:flavin monoamine oxidase family protein n=1 Tax=Myxococcus sp. CA033 TaxID=2741516 RepID=UPI00157B06E0|nr:NAD(P)/FAD-dependent oxidoreductase [Myxococcus sp. CA033]NTX33454.1 FAD-dependent oxidoreductase [Myxococcus sp. CA033]